MRLRQLDMLRGLAILLVLGRHPPGSLLPALNEPARTVLQTWLKIGWTGVDLFFVTTIALGFATLLALVLPVGHALGVASAGGLRSLPGRTLASIGTNSYSIYLWHVPFRAWAIEPLHQRGWFAIDSPTLSYSAAFGAFVVGSILIGAVLARLVELPALALRERLFPSRSGLPVG